MKILRPLTWAYIILAAGVIGMIAVLIAGTQGDEVYKNTSLIALSTLFLIVFIFVVLWIINAFIVFRQVRKGSGTEQQLDRRLYDLNLPGGQWDVWQSQKLKDKWNENKK